MRRKTEKKARRSACGQAGTGPAAPDKQKGTTPEAAAPAEEEPAGEEEPDPDQPEELEPEEPETPEKVENPEEDPSPDEVIAALEEQLLDARCRLAAFAAGVAPDLVADAVTLAVQAARAEGEVTEESVAAAMEQVLQRHPAGRPTPAAPAGSAWGQTLPRPGARTRPPAPPNAGTVFADPNKNRR